MIALFMPPETIPAIVYAKPVMDEQSTNQFRFLWKYTRRLGCGSTAQGFLSMLRNGEMLCVRARNPETGRYESHFFEKKDGYSLRILLGKSGEDHLSYVYAITREEQRILMKM